MPTIVYYAPGYDHDGKYPFEVQVKDRWSFDAPDSWESQWIAEECAKDWHWEHDGWESEYPITFVCWEKDKPEKRYTFTIDMEMTPEFSANLVDDEETVTD